MLCSGITPGQAWKPLCGACPRSEDAFLEKHNKLLVNAWDFLTEAVGGRGGLSLWGGKASPLGFLCWGAGLFPKHRCAGWAALNLTVTHRRQSVLLVFRKTTAAAFRELE